MAAPKKPKRKPIKQRLSEVATRDGFLTVLLAELDETTGDTARSGLLKMIGQVMQHFEPPPPPEPEDDDDPAALLSVLIADLPAWSDEELLAAHAEGLRRGIPGFTARV